VNYCRSDFVIRAYDIHSGALLWEKRYQCGFGASVFADGRQVFVAGSRLDPNTLLKVGAVSALDAKTGIVQWQVKTASSIDPSLFPTQSASDSAVQVKGNRVYVAGQMSGRGAAGLALGMFVQAFDRDSGVQLWRYDIRGSGSQLLTYYVPLAVAGNVLVVGDGVARNGTSALEFDYRLTALDVRSGTLLWTDQVHRQALGLASALGFGAGKLFAYGWDCDQNVLNCHGDVRAYDPQSGALQWEKRFTGPGGDIVIPVPAPAFAVSGNQVFLGTALLNLAGDEYEWTVQAYDGRTGSLRWQNQIYDGGGYGDAIEGLKVRDDHLYASGYANRPDGGYDFTVRAYEVDD
jgi:outer membrane protein assembly factor BamB